MLVSTPYFRSVYSRNLLPVETFSVQTDNYPRIEEADVVLLELAYVFKL